MTFSIVVTVFVRPLLVPQVLFNISRQEETSWELLFVADGPHPKAHAIVNDFRHESPDLASKVRYLTCPHMPGTWGNMARRHGLERATGDYTIFLSHDCLVFPNFLTAHAENIARTPGCLSLVDIDCWITRIFGHPHKLRPHPHYAGISPSRNHPFDELEVGEIDLTCMAFPTVRARELGVFSKELNYYAADYFSAYLSCNKVLPVVHRPGVVAAHF